jgi:hypothetical protein
MECPYCHTPLEPESPCMAHPPVPMSYWPSRSGMPEMLPEMEAAPAPSTNGAD